ncbi:MAG: DegT/DnrJ/EryC1/StrS family aminotransferase [Melioribacteraceae bacterium]|nr:DegT/DnrJ/EryC1/StrS family aminotransferase [Melioribacteraceae bacterium]MCF8264836.1 DegT/DnrJ/EryC1/StrS family aminotransferase [Melioribacteraceae bacterium]MCF8431753.1 DegT/DnrJ/EryC1/StrS family aminotransferase [Melioribacteraceae bacterium]
MNVPLLDLKAQYQTLKPELDKALIDCAESQYFILGPQVKEMEEQFQEYLGVKHAFGVSSGTDALLIALMAIDIQPGDEVILPTYSFFATAGVVSRLNAVPVFVDCDPVSFNIDPNQIEAKITEKTKAIIPVHLYGQSADMEPIMAIAKKHNLKVVEDGAQAISTQYKDGKCAGTIGDIGCYSFFPSKNLGCFGDGGLVVTNDDDLAYQLKIKRVHGGDPKYYHKVIGGNFRLDAIQAAVIQVKLPHLDKWSEGRRQNAAMYTKLFIEAGLSESEGILEFTENNKVLLPKALWAESGHKNYHIYNQYIIRVDKRDELQKFLKENGIGSEVYYPVPFHRQECFADLNQVDSDYPVANFAAEHSLALPIYPELSGEQLEYVVERIGEFLNR